MGLKSVRVTPRRRHLAAELPSALTPGAARLVRFAQSGIVDRVAAALPLARRGGHGVVELFALTVLFLSVRERSIRGFYSTYTAVWPRIAAIVDRRTLPSGAAVSRALGRLRIAQITDFASFLLATPVERIELLKNPVVQHRDALGRSWHVFDFDPTTRPFRQRDLDEGPDLPEPERRAKGVPGHMGRKRGEIRQQDHLLLHAGSGLWCSYQINAEGGSARPFFAAAVGAACRWMNEIGHALERVLVREDGEFGHAAAIRACVDRGVHYLVRIARYHLFDRPDVAQSLANAPWWQVPGTSKYAADLGMVMLHDTDGEFEPVEVRVIVTRRPTQQENARHGVVRNGWQLEMFATSLAADAWPAPDVVALYAGRNNIENSFAQEDREYDLERTFSYNPAGQAFFVAIGLFLWNDAVCRAAAATQLPTALPAQELRRPGTPIAGPFLTVPTAPEGRPPAPPASAPVIEPQSVDAELRSIAVDAANARGLLENWSLDADLGVLRCPTGKPLHPFNAQATSVGPDGDQRGQNRLSFRSAVGVCDGCPLRSTCTTIKPNSYRQISFAVPQEQAVRARAILTAARKRFPPIIARRPSPPRRDTEKPLFRPMETTEGGSLRPWTPTFSPGLARRLMREALSTVVLQVVIRRRRSRPACHPLITTAPNRRGTRLSWTERSQRASALSTTLVTAAATRRIATLLAF